MTWPLQIECDAFYGNPRGRDGRASPVWEKSNIVRVTPPFIMTFAGKPLKTIPIHKKCANSLLRALGAIWDAAGRDQKRVNEWGASIYGGSYVYRLKRGGGTLSMHAYGCALDLDPARNGFHDASPRFGADPQHVVVRALEAEGWTWGGRWKGRSRDGMHTSRPRRSHDTPGVLRSRLGRGDRRALGVRRAARDAMTHPQSNRAGRNPA